MIKISNKKIYNSYIIETYNYALAKKSIKEFAIQNGFDRVLVESDNHPDIYYLELEDKNIPIELIRQNILEPAVYSPKISDKKIYVIYDCINLSETVQNAMLKTLEEPPNFDIFFLVSSNANEFLETIISRCVIIKDNEEADYKELLNLPYIKDAVFMLANVKYLLASEKMEFAEKVLEKGNNIKDLIMLYRYLLRDSLLYKMTLSKKNLYLRELEDDIITISSMTQEELGKLIENLNLFANEVSNNVNKKISLFNFFEV